MEELTKTEERIMQVLWKLKRAFVKDIIQHLEEDPAPPYTTISSVVRILERKGYVRFKAYGKTYEYSPVISKLEYRAASLKRMLTQYFDNSPSALVSFMVEEENLSSEEMQRLRQLLDQASPDTAPTDDAR